MASRTASEAGVVVAVHRDDAHRFNKQTVDEITLLGQPFVKDPDQTIEKLLKSAGASVREFQRFEVGAGIEKKQEDFVAEVMAQVGAAGRS